MSDTNTAPAAPTAEPETQADRPYEVGYGKPPQSTQFKKGRSGNPRASREPKSAAEIGASLLARSMTIIEKGRRRRITIYEGIMMAQGKKALAGCQKAAKLLMEMSARAPPPQRDLTLAELEEIAVEAQRTLTKKEQEVYRKFDEAYMRAINRILERKKQRS